ncbi:InlB B-repeat-containing protein [Methanorbis rubei]
MVRGTKSSTTERRLRHGFVLAVFVVVFCSVLITGAVSAENWTDAGNFNASWYDTYSGGDTFYIYDAASLAAFSEKVSKNSSKSDFSGKTVILMEDIDLGAYNWTAIGSNSRSFNGTFDGRYHTIKNLMNPVEYDMGLFGYTNGATIRNLAVSKISVSISRSDTTSQSAGGLVGYVVDTQIENITISDGQITSNQAWSICGSVVGVLSGNSIIENCTSSKITVGMNAGTGNNMAQYAGGFVGSVGSKSVITESAAIEVTIVSQNELNGLGGFVGYCEGQIDNCSVAGTVQGTGKVVGGFVGQERVNSKITDCYSNVEIIVPKTWGSGETNIGGFVGTTKGSTLENCYAVGKISVIGDPMTNVGGFLGQIRSDSSTVTTIRSCAVLVSSISVTQGEDNVGRFIGYVLDDNQQLTNTYGWDNLGYTDDSGTPIKGSSYNGTGVSTAEFWGKQSFFSDTLGWNFEHVWKMNSGNNNYQLPVLSWQKTPVPGDANYLNPKPPVPPVPPTSSSSSDGNMDNAFRVLFDTQGGSFVQPATGLSYGDKIGQPAVPTKDGYNFGGWYKDAACTIPWMFGEDAVSGDITLYAKWIPVSTVTLSATEKPTSEVTQIETVRPTNAPTSSSTQNTTASVTSSAEIPPTMTQAPAPVFGMLTGLFAVGIFLRRRT